MKKQLTALTLLLGSLAFLNAAAPVLQKDGSLELDGWRGTPTTFSFPTPEAAAFRLRLPTENSKAF